MKFRRYSSAVSSHLWEGAEECLALKIIAGNKVWKNGKNPIDLAREQLWLPAIPWYGW